MDHYGELLKQGKVDRVRDRLVASVVRMQMITRRKVRHQTAGMLRVAHDRVEVDDPSNEPLLRMLAASLPSTPSNNLLGSHLHTA